MKRLAMLVFAGLLTSSLAVGASAAKSDSQNGSKDRKVTSKQVLNADPTSEVAISSLEAIKFSDGSVQIKGSGTQTAGAEATSFAWDVNLEKGTYKTTKIDLKTQKELEKSPTSSKNPASTNGEVGTMAVYTGTYTGTVQVSTKDPANWTTAWTKQSLTWNTYDDGTVAIPSRSLSYWVAQPTPADTYWYLTDYYYSGGLFYPSPSQGSVATHAFGKYYNYDWGFDTQRTDAEHWIYIEGLNTGRYYYEWSGTHSGESSSLLRGTVIAN